MTPRGPQVHASRPLSLPTVASDMPQRCPSLRPATLMHRCSGNSDRIVHVGASVCFPMIHALTCLHPALQVNTNPCKRIRHGSRRRQKAQQAQLLAHSTHSSNGLWFPRDGRRHRTSIHGMNKDNRRSSQSCHPRLHQCQLLCHPCRLPSQLCHCLLSCLQLEFF